MSVTLEQRPQRTSARHGGTISFEITGPAHAPVVVVLGGISSSRHVTATGDAGSRGWWPEIVGPDRAIDTRRYRVLSIDYVGEREDGAAVRTSDQADAVAVALDAARVDRAAAIVGASYGGMVALSFGATHGERAGHLIVISATHVSAAHATALRVLQRRVVELGIETGREAEAVAIARGIATTAYGTPAQFRGRFAADGIDDEAEWQVAKIGEYLTASAEEFARRCPASRFLALSRSLDLHRVNPEDIHVPATLVAVRHDQLVPVEQARELAARLGAPCRLVELDSVHGHDAFLGDPAAFTPLLSATLSSCTRYTP